MGVGDEIMAAGQAQEVYVDQPARSAGPLKVRIRDVAGRKRWHEIWEGNPVIAGPHDHGVTLNVTNGPNARPYIRYPFTIKTGWQWSGWKASDHVGRIYLNDDERRLGKKIAADGPFVFVEASTIPKQSSINRTWPWGSFVEVIRQNAHLRFIQPLYGGRRVVPGVTGVETSFRAACGILARATAYLGTEGGFQHAARALEIPSVVIFGGCINVDVLGYPQHRNIVADTPGTPCGHLEMCDHCVEAMMSITPDRVTSELLDLVGPSQCD